MVSERSAYYLAPMNTLEYPIAIDNNHTNVDLLGCPRILDWVHRSIDNTDNAQLYAFTLRLLSLLMANEQQRRAILESDVCSKFVQTHSNPNTFDLYIVSLAEYPLTWPPRAKRITRRHRPSN